MQDLADLRAFVARLPKTEQHLHLEGALPFAKLRELDPARFAEEPPFYAEDYVFGDFKTFESSLIGLAMNWFEGGVERYHEGARAVFEVLAAQNVKYVEISFHLPILDILKMDGEEVVAAIHAATPEGMEVRVFLGMPHNVYTGAMKNILESALSWERLAGIDLHGDEALPFEPWTPDVWKRAREAGKRLKAHAGEFGGAGNVRYVVEELGVERVQHGVRAAEDADVLALLADRDIVCDVCPISNVKLGVSPSFQDHPLPEMLRAGVPCTLNTDDPLVFGNRLEEEYVLAGSRMGLSKTGLLALCREGFLRADLDERRRRVFLDELEAIGAEQL